MINLASSTDLIQLVTNGLTPIIQVAAEFCDYVAGGVTPGRTNTLIATTGTLTTTVVGSPAAGTVRNASGLCVYNAGARSTIVTVQHVQGGGATATLFGPITLLPGYTLLWLDGQGFELITPTGKVVTMSPDSAVFGSGTDGAAVFDGTSVPTGSSLSGTTYTISRDVFYSSITVASGITVYTANSAPTSLTAAPFRMFCSGTFENNGTVGLPGGNANGATRGFGFSGSGSVGFSRAGNSGTTGNGTTPAAITNSLSGHGGAGGNGNPGTGGAASTATTPGGTIYPGPGAQAVLGYVSDLSQSPSWVSLNGGNGGASGGGDGANSSGGGGGGGGICIIAAQIIVGAGAFTVAGGNGGNSVAGNTGGGGGGGGGTLILCSANTSGFTGTTTAAGGALGIGTGTGTSGANGTAGLVYNIAA